MFGRPIFRPLAVTLVLAFVVGTYESLSFCLRQAYFDYHLYQYAVYLWAVACDRYFLVFATTVYLLWLIHIVGKILQLPLRAPFEFTFSIATLTGTLSALGLLVKLRAGTASLINKSTVGMLFSDFKWQLLLAAIFLVVSVISIMIWRRTRSVSTSTVVTTVDKPPFRIPGWRPFLYGCIFIFVAINLCAGCFRGLQILALRRRPNVIMIMMDTTRADHLGCYGYPRDTTPNIDRLARDGMLFKSAYSQAPWTYWSVSSFMTSRYPEAMDLGSTFVHRSLLPRYLTLAEAMKSQGYDTVATSSNLMYGSSLNCQQGFDVFDEVATWFDISSPIVAKSALTQLQRLGDKRFFMFLLFADPHYPYLEHKGFEIDSGSLVKMGRNPMPGCNPMPESHDDMGEQQKRMEVRIDLPRYDSEIKFTDYWIGKVLSELKRRELYDNSLIVFLADHGNEFLDHDGFSHGHTLYNELVHVPLIVKLPNQAKPSVIEGDFPFIDLFPSLMGVLRCDWSHFGLSGSDARLSSLARCRPKPIFFATDNLDASWKGGSLRGVYDAPYKYVEERINHRKGLFNLQEDPREQHNLLLDGQHPDATWLKALMKNHDKEVGAPDTENLGKHKSRPALSERNTLSLQEKRRLRALGYAQ